MAGNTPDIKTWVFPPRLAQPAVGTDWSWVNQDEGVALVTSLTFQLTTSAVVANRLVRVELFNGTEVYSQSNSSLAQAASLTYFYTAFDGLTGAGSIAPVARITCPNNGWPVWPGFTLRSVTTNLDAGDQFTAIAFKYLLLPKGPGYDWQPDKQSFDPRMGY